MKFWCSDGHFNEDQAEYFKVLIDKHNPKYVLETGFCTGRSTAVVLVNAKNIEKMISIDINFDYVKILGREYRKILEDNFPCFSTIEDDSKNVLNDTFLKREFPNGIDWFTVDGDHSYGGCLFDLRSVHKHMNKGGIIIIDDYKSGKPNGAYLPEVTRACDDFHKEHPEINKVEWYKKGKGFCVFKF